MNIFKLQSIYAFIFTTMTCGFAFATNHVVTEGSSIQAAINIAVAGDTVSVETGTYSENISINKNIVVIGIDGAGSTVIDGTGGTSCVTFTNDVSNVCKLIGFSLTGASYGAHLQTGRPLISGCIFMGLTNFQLFKAYPQEVGYYAANNLFFLNYTGKFDGIYVRRGIISSSTFWPALPSGMSYLLDNETAGCGADYVVSIEGSGSPQLTIEEGAIVKMVAPYGGTCKAEQDVWVGVNGAGRLNATGAYFTASTDDDIGGDTNGDGSATTPTPGHWSVIRFGSLSGGSVMDGCFIRYGGTSVGNSLVYSAVYIENSSPTITNCEFSSNTTSIRVSGGNPTLTNNTISGGTGYGMWLDIPDVTPNVSGNVIENGLSFQARLDPMAVGFFVNNNTLHLNPIGTSDAIEIERGIISASCVWPALPSGMSYLLDNETAGCGADYVVSIEGSGSPQLTIEEGAIVKMVAPYGGTCKAEQDVWVGVNGAGRLNATGAYFTASTDDDIGGDTNGDGSATTPTPGHWSVIRFGSLSGGSVMDGCFIRYGGTSVGNSLVYSAVYISQNSVNITNCVFSHNTTAIRVSDGSPIISGCEIFNNNIGVLSSGSSYELHSNSLYNNSAYAVQNTSNGVIIDATENWWGHNSGPYDPTDAITGPPDYNVYGQGDNVSDYVEYRPWKIVPVGETPEDYLRASIYQFRQAYKTYLEKMATGVAEAFNYQKSILKLSEFESGDGFYQNLLSAYAGTEADLVADAILALNDASEIKALNMEASAVSSIAEMIVSEYLQSGLRETWQTLENAYNGPELSPTDLKQREMIVIQELTPRVHTIKS